MVEGPPGERRQPERERLHVEHRRRGVARGDDLRAPPHGAPREPLGRAVRTVLAPSLTLESLTGELLVIEDSRWASWTGTERFLARGATAWARAEGAYGSSVRLDLRADGQATWGEHTYDEVTGDIGWREVPATYAVKRTGAASAPRRVDVTVEDRTVGFTLGVESGWSYKDAPLFVLEPIHGDAPKLLSLVSESDA